MQKGIESSVVGGSMEKTIHSCISEDQDCMKRVQESMDLLIGHGLIEKTVTGNYYRGHVFSVTLERKS